MAKRYEVTVQIGVVAFVEVEAESDDEARRIAEARNPSELDWGRPNDAPGHGMKATDAYELD
jgi:hypothetical protein